MEKKLVRDVIGRTTKGREKRERGEEWRGIKLNSALSKAFILILPAIGIFSLKHRCQIQMVSIRKWPVHEILELGHDDKVII